MPASTSRTHRKILLILTVSLFSLISFGALELLTRLIFPWPLDNVLLFSNNVILNYNAELGWALNPGLTQRILTIDDESTTYNVNSYGFRGDEPVSREIDVLFVGDSMTFGYNSNTSYPEEFSKISNLRSVNAGVLGYGTDQSFLMTRFAIETKGVTPKHVVYGFYYNDIQNNLSEKSIHTSNSTLVHKPILNLETNRYQPANYRANDLTSEFQEPDVLEIVITLLSKSKFLRALGRVIKYDLIGYRDSRAVFDFDEVARKYLERNLDNFSDYLRTRGEEFVILHIPSKVRPDLDRELEAFLRKYCYDRKVLYVYPILDSVDYLKRDFHLSSQGAHKVAGVLRESMDKFSISKAQ